MNWQYANQENTTVSRTNADGSFESCLVSVIADWIAEGNTPDPYIPPPPVIAPVSPRQIRQALTRAGLRTSVEAAVAAGDQDLKDWWEFSTTFERLNPQVTAMGAALGVSDAQLDDLWMLAGTL